MKPLKIIFLAFFITILNLQAQSCFKIWCELGNREHIKGDFRKAAENYNEAISSKCKDKPTNAAKIVKELIKKNELKAWETTRVSQDIKLYDKFINDFRESQYITNALEYKKLLVEDKAWEESKQINTFEIYNKYNKEYPNGRHKKEVLVKIQDLWLKTLGLENFIKVTGGKFWMGCTEDQGGDCEEDFKIIKEEVVNDFEISIHEITQKQWITLMGYNPSIYKNCDDCPVENVSYSDIQAFIDSLYKKTLKNFRLPTEIEWEYAARGGLFSKHFKFAGSNNISEVGWCQQNTSQTKPIKTKKPNELGLYDMSGNVLEFCETIYSSSDTKNQPIKYIVRGGSWESLEKDCRVSVRDISSPDFKSSFIGFRLVLSSV
jgi:formylglycine-generating enzyme required for sulfatase activity